MATVGEVRTPPVKGRLIGAREAGLMLNKSPRTIQDWCKSGKVPFAFFHDGAEYSFDSADIEAYLWTIRVAPKWERSA